MSKPLYSGQGYLNKSEALGLKIYLDNHGQCTKAETLVQSKVFFMKIRTNTYVHCHVRMY